MSYPDLFNEWLGAGGHHSVCEPIFTFFMEADPFNPAKRFEGNLEEYLGLSFEGLKFKFEWSYDPAGKGVNVLLDGESRGNFPSLGEVFQEFFAPKGWSMSHARGVIYGPKSGVGVGFADLPASYPWCREVPVRPAVEKAVEKKPAPSGREAVAKELARLDKAYLAAREAAKEVEEAMRSLGEAVEALPAPKLTSGQDLILTCLATRLAGDEVASGLLAKLRESLSGGE